MKVHEIKDLKSLKKEGNKSLYPVKTKIMVGMATCGRAAGALDVYDNLMEKVKDSNIDLHITKTGCIGYCQVEPIVDVIFPGLPRITYHSIMDDKVNQLLKSAQNGEIIPEWVLCRTDREDILILETEHKYSKNGIPDEYNEFLQCHEIPFFKKQLKIILRNTGHIDPENINEYIARGGYFSLFKSLKEIKPEDVIKEVQNSGLRGRGGGGFPTGLKWKFCRASKGEPKYIVCNAHEGDPGAYMDRRILESDPHSVIEGMIIGAHAIGASKGFIYIGVDYYLAIDTLKKAIEKATEYGFLGENILGTDFSFDLRIAREPGAFVCGEETALIAAIEGRLTEPRPRPPFPTESGIYGKPTVVNNVKSWASVPPIMARGAKWFSNIGTEKSKGTMVFALTGKVRNSGLVEVPMGIALKDLIFGIGGGIAEGKDFKAVQTGGPSGGCIPGSMLDMPVDYERLTEAGSMMGSGGLVVADEETCMVDLAKFFLNFTKNESCGKCTPCREGVPKMYDILERITSGDGKLSDVEELETLGNVIKETAVCGLGQTAPNPILTTLKYFRDEYEEHILRKNCPSMVCSKIIFTPCKYNCPVHTNIPDFFGYLARREYEKAFDTIYDGNPFAVTCGYVCHHACEDLCRAGDMGGNKLSIKALKRYIGDKLMAKGHKPKVEKTKLAGPKVAVIGAGPAGLGAAHELVKMGHPVTVFEADSKPGGMPASAIPNFRLNKSILEMEIEAIKSAGVEIRTNTRIGDDVKFEELFDKGFKAILISIGAEKNVPLSIPGEDAEGVLKPIEFLWAVNKGEKPSLPKEVVVVGGGNAAIDVARTARRLGSNVSIVFENIREEMEAFQGEIQAGIDEGIKIEFLARPKRIIVEDGKMAGLECIRMELGDLTETGHREIVHVEGSELVINAECLFPAIKQVPNASFLNGASGIELNDDGTIKVDSETLYTGKNGVFACGDAVSGTSTVSDSLSLGKIAAQMIDKFLKGEKVIREHHITEPGIKLPMLELSDEELEMLAETGRPEMPLADVKERVMNFNMVELGYSDEDALRESERCLRCDLREE